LLRGNLEKVVHHGKRADGIVRNMLLHAREGGGERRSVNFNTTMEEALNLAYHGVRAEKPGFNVNLERRYDPNAGSLELYPQEFTRVLLNLIGNGFYAVDRRGAPILRTRRPLRSQRKRSRTPSSCAFAIMAPASPIR
jgi:nitrogen-specific signal transduction histidine kinase